MKMTVKDLLAIEHLQVHRPETLKEVTIHGVSTDSRTVRQGDLFFAIRGEIFDGHDFVSAAVEEGIACAIVDRRFDYSSTDLPLVIVEDTVKALGQLACRYRRKFDIPVVAITGSSGKTTTKEMVKSTLKYRYSVLGTEGNLNNHIGVPMTLFRLNRGHDLAVIEMGMNHEGEIANLCAVAEPTHGVITNIGKAHLGFFGSLDRIASAKGELFDWLALDRSRVGFVNADDRHVVAQSKKLKQKRTYGLSATGAQVRGKVLDDDRYGCPRFSIARSGSKRPLIVQSRIAGHRNVSNALAAAAIGFEFGVPGRDIKTALESFQPMENRMQIAAVGGVTILNDTYNANPESVASTLEAFQTMKCPGKKIVILGDMLELGEYAQEEHEKIAALINRLGFQCVLTYGATAACITEKLRCEVNLHYDQKNILSEYAAELVVPGDIVLVKGSRGMKMDDVVVFLLERLRRKIS